MTLVAQDTIDAVRRWLALPKKMLIAGQWVEAADERRFETEDPSDGTILAAVPRGGVEDIDRAVAAARAAFEGPWRRVTPAERARMLLRLADLMERHRDELAVLETLDNGKMLKVSHGLDIPFCVDRLRYNAGWATKITGDTVPVSMPGDWLGYTVREPVGVVGHIVAWNAPLPSTIGKLAPSLAAGWTMVLKPAEQTPLSALRLGELIEEAGIPPGVVNIVTGFGDEAGAAMATHDDIDKISFTGSTEVGKLLVRAAAGNLKRLTLELGGKSPVIVMPDADLDRAIPAVAAGIFFCSGQVCTAGSRLFAHHSIFDDLMQGLTETAAAMPLGAGLDAATQIAPLISARQQSRVAAYIAAGQADGAEVVTGGARPDRPGYFIEPTILTKTHRDMSVRREEIFGPVLCAQPFDDTDLEAVAQEANDTSFGLAASVFTQDLGTAHKLASRIKAGTVKINGGGLDQGLPAGGFKQSGWGREYGREGVEIYTETKSVLVAL